MLILARKVGQNIVIGDSVEITILNIRGDQVRLGITAPRDIAVYRKEILKRIPPNAANADDKPDDAAHPTNDLRAGTAPDKSD